MPLPPPPGSDDPSAPPPAAGRGAPPRDTRELGLHLVRLLEEMHRNSAETLARVRWICDTLQAQGIPKAKFDPRKFQKDVRAGADLLRDLRDTFFGAPRPRR